MAINTVTLLVLLHVFGVVIWVGGMIFMHGFVRPAAADLPPQVKLPLIQQILGRFFIWVVVSIAAILGSGIAMMAMMGPNAPAGVKAMAALGIVMMLLFGHIRFALYPKLRRAVQTQNWADGAAVLAKLRRWVGVNMTLGIVTIVIAVLAS
jgi:uncharacterized membrane protein